MCVWGGGCGDEDEKGVIAGCGCEEEGGNRKNSYYEGIIEGRKVIPIFTSTFEFCEAETETETKTETKT